MVPWKKVLVLTIWATFLTVTAVLMELIQSDRHRYSTPISVIAFFIYSFTLMFIGATFCGLDVEAIEVATLSPHEENKC